MTEQYRDLDENIITQEQAIGSHYKDFLDNNVKLKLREIKFGSEIESILYYKDLNENFEHIINNYSNIQTVQAIFIRERQNYGKFVIEEEREYWREGSKLLKLQPFTTKWLYDQNRFEIACEIIDPSLPISDPEHRAINKSYLFGTTAEYPQGEIPSLSTGYNGYNEPFDFMVFDRGTDDDQDCDQLDMQEAIEKMTACRIPKNMQDWYLNDIFLPPLD